ncbi:hypothetical protein D9619_006150 [Psilocybe cf. subviscida]|uniref:Uncharacterized protein n=1 Tax=Psilocybe cf. subviscida TaxID=2480587 RepID=A0A8H5EYL2_9AGAR|nr:hypothetical protein D9619_006150 [Psilocybe cf. subviscida]
MSRREQPLTRPAPLTLLATGGSHGSYALCDRIVTRRLESHAPERRVAEWCAGAVGGMWRALAETQALCDEGAGREGGDGYILIITGGELPAWESRGDIAQTEIVLVLASADSARFSTLFRLPLTYISEYHPIPTQNHTLNTTLPTSPTRPPPTPPTPTQYTTPTPPHEAAISTSPAPLPTYGDEPATPTNALPSLRAILFPVSFPIFSRSQLQEPLAINFSSSRSLCSVARSLARALRSHPSSNYRPGFSAQLRRHDVAIVIPRTHRPRTCYIDRRFRP